MKLSAVSHMNEGTDLVQFQNKTGEVTPKKQPPQWMPFGEVAQQLKETQDTGIIQPSSGLWSSPVVLV